MKQILTGLFFILFVCCNTVYGDNTNSTQKNYPEKFKQENCHKSIPTEKTTQPDPNENSTEDDIEEPDNNNSDIIYLDVPSSQYSNKYSGDKQKQIPSTSIDKTTTEDNMQISPQTIQTYRNNDIYAKKTTSFSKEKKYKNLIFGTKYDNSFTPNLMEQSRTLFTKYEKDRFSIGTSYKNNSLSSFDQQFRGTFSFSPEYKINKHLSLQGIYSKNFMDRSNKNEVIFTLKPFKDDRMDFNVGAGQIYYEGTTPARSQFNFATKIKF